MLQKKRLYTELCKVMDIIHGALDNIEDTREEHLEDVMEINKDIDDVKERINYTLNKLLSLTERVEALEAKKQRKATIKPTKKTKGK